jgi:hypothetical protein
VLAVVLGSFGGVSGDGSKGELLFAVVLMLVAVVLVMVVGVAVLTVIRRKFIII